MGMSSELRCSGEDTEKGSACGGTLEPQAAGRYVHYEFVPYLCGNPHCSQYGIPYDFHGKRRQWEDFEKRIQVREEPHG